jgi:hypothetical protein
MEFIKVGKNYMIKNSNGRIVSEKEKRQLEQNKLQLEEPHCKECEIKITKKKKTATSKKEIANDIIKETNTTI